MSEAPSRTSFVRHGLDVRCDTCGAETTIIVRKPGPRHFEKSVSCCPRCGSRMLAVFDSPRNRSGDCE